MIKAFLFDWGGVMSAGGRGGELDARLAKNLGVTPEAARGLLKVVWDDYARGSISEHELWARIEQKYRNPIPRQHRAIWNTWEHTSLLPEMANFLSQLKSQGYKVGLVSNVIFDTADEIRRHGGYDIFDFTVLSYEVGLAKPDREIYELAMQKLPGISPSETVFIDDQERCLVPARDMGMQTVLSVTPEQVIRDVHVLLG